MIEMKMECGHGSVVEEFGEPILSSQQAGLWLAGWLARFNFRSTPRFIHAAKYT